MKLATKHLFPFIKMINKLEIKEDLKNFFSKKIDVSDKTEEEKQLIVQDRGMDFVFIILEKLPNAEQEVYEMLSLYSGKTVDEIKEADLEETIDLIKSLFQDKLFKSFFRQAVK